MEDENKITEVPQEETVSVKEAKKIYFSAFTTGFLFAVLIGMLAYCGPTLYSRYFKHKMGHEAKARAIYALMKEYYIDDIDTDEMYEGIYAGMAAMPTDQYSYYMSAEAAEDYNEKTDGNYVGIGIQIQSDPEADRVEITAVFKPSPAYDIGVKKGDILKSVSGVEITAANMDEAVEMVRGPENTTVDFVVYRPSEDRDIEMTSYRKKVDMNTVFGRMLDERTGYIRITNFEGVTPGQYSTVLDELTKAGMTRLVIDVRNNPGGLLTSVSRIADSVIPKGTLTYTEDKNGKRDYVYTDDIYMDIPLAVLVNAGSASASELFSGAVKDTGVGTIVGKTTYGKGIVQTPFPLPDGSIVKLTTARYYTPNGICIDGVGIVPDVEVDAAEDFELPDINDEEITIDIEADLQLKKALEVLEDETKSK